jgi:predicted nucleic acid-binding protein
MTEYNLIDSSLWIDYLVSGRYRDKIETDGKLLLATISLIEISKKLSNLKVPVAEIKKKIEYIKSQSILINLDETVADKASEFVTKKQMPMADSVVYASAIVNGATLFTLDNDFRGLEKAEIL